MLGFFFVTYGSPQQGTMPLTLFIIFKHLINYRYGILQKNTCMVLIINNTQSSHIASCKQHANITHPTNTYTSKKTTTKPHTFFITKSQKVDHIDPGLPHVLVHPQT
jgi:hypothetical protein